MFGRPFSLRCRRSATPLAALLATAVVTAAAAADQTRLKLTVDTGFFERRDALVSARLDFGHAVDLRKATLRDPKSRRVPFQFVPDTPFRGTLHWVMAGDTNSIEKVPFVLTVPAGPWSATPVGPKALAELVRRHRNLLPNPGFELPEDNPKQSTTWHGTRGAAHWELHDHAWAYRNMPHIQALCRPTQEEVGTGHWALKFQTDVREDAPKARPGAPVVLAPYINGPVVPILPGKRYRFSYRVKFEKVARDGYISASVNFLDANKKRLFPRKYAINRMQAAYGTARNLRRDYLGKWVTVSVVKETLPEVRFGQVVIGGGFGGVCYLDDFRLREVETGDPPTVQAGPLQAVGAK